MSGTEQLFKSEDDMYDEFDCKNNDEENEGIVVKEEDDDSETYFDALESVDQSAGNESEIKTEEQNGTSIDMYDDAYHFILEKDFAATAENVSEVSEALSENEESETNSDATEIDDEDYEANLSKLKQRSMEARAVHQVNDY
ncbi:hypothetical protein TYRP_009013 [Tyrophagus putrescentiae]|nr:hypothetical protein TYRP_009013 [Tyrophagus putrescentiae]